MTKEGLKGFESLKGLEGLKGSGCFERISDFGELHESGTQSSKL